MFSIYLINPRTFLKNLLMFPHYILNKFQAPYIGIQYVQ